jgi:regulator of sirC expression with transglutaminase-like and TPR domain
MVAQTDEDIDLAKAALYVSGMEYPDIDVGYYLTTLDSLAEGAINYTNRSGDLGETIQGLSEFLFVDQAFRGNEAEYYDPRNSYLNEVLDRKSGIPITLCLLYMEVARRMGMVFEGIGLPGHFVIRTGPPDQELYVDPFHGGQRMSRSDCEQTVRVLFQGRIPFQDEFLRPYTKREFLVRIITNLKHNYFRANDHQRAVNAADLINILDPSQVSNLREKAVLHYNLKQYRLAIRDLESYLEKDPNANDAEDVRKQVQAIWSILRSLN